MLLALAASPLACVSEIAPLAEVDALESVTALSRDLEFEAQVFVPVGSSDGVIKSSIDAQNQTAFGTLIHNEIAVNTKELKAAPPASWVKEEVDVVDTATGRNTGKQLRVRYKYVDKAVMPKRFARRTTFSLALLNKTFVADAKLRPLCTANDEHSRSYPLWYELDTTMSSCADAIRAEVEAVRAAGAKLGSRVKRVSKVEVERVYQPITIKMGPRDDSRISSYPEYNQLLRGGVEPNKLVIGLVNGFIDDGADKLKDSGWEDYFDELRGLAAARSFKLVSAEGAAVASLVPNKPTPTLKDFVAADSAALRRNIMQKWLVFEAPVKVKIGSEAERDFTIKAQVYFGAGSSAVPHKRAVKTSDVFVYNGHSYIGAGPLDPRNFAPTDFPATYQILWIDSCVSYNYYEKDYFPIKAKAVGSGEPTLKLDLITNGLEAPAYASGDAIGEWLQALISGTQPSYKQLLLAAKATDPLRVVDGEIDNSYSPSAMPITIKNR